MERTSILYGRDALTIEHDEHCSVLRPAHARIVPDAVAAIHHALANPIGSPPLSELAAKMVGKRVVIVISDITRPVPNRVLLPPILEVLERAGHSPDAITILVATGMHRPSTHQEHVELAGQRVVDSYRIVDHHADRQDELCMMPNLTRSGTRVWVNRLYAEADLKIVTGFIEPHFMAGFSGGRKAICPGLVNLETIQKFHSPAFLENPLAMSGLLDGNPCHEEALEVARAAGIDFLVNVTVTTDQDITGVFAGHFEQAHRAGAESVSRAMGIEVRREYDVVVTCGGGYPLDTTFYQAVKGMVQGSAFVRQGGVLVIASSCTEGIGSPSYLEIMRRYAGGLWWRFVEDIKQNSRVERDQWEFEMQCRVLRKTGPEGLYFVTHAVDEATLRDCSVTPAPGCGVRPAQDILNDLLGSLRAKHPDAQWAIIPSGPYILPRIPVQR